MDHNFLKNNQAFSQDTNVPHQAAALDIWDRKYRLKTKSGEIIDKTIDDTFKRVAKALAGVETTDALKNQWFHDFLWALRRGALPAGRILSNAGAQAYKPETSAINCTVSGTIEDSMSDILSKVHEAGMTLKAGCGIGYEFSTLRPRGAYVSGAGAFTSGPLSFMDIFDKTCFTVMSAGGRRGAQMATFDIGHPDVVEFIRAKREDGRLRQFNLSLLITEEFMHAVDRDEAWRLSFPITRSELDGDGLDVSDPDEIMWRDWPVKDGYVCNDKGKVACRVFETIPARRLWDIIMVSAYEYAEPGFILIDKYNEMNNNWFCENIRATNPCGEQGLPPYGSCLLGSINLTRFVHHPFTDQAGFDWDDYIKVVKVFTRMLDNVVDINGLSLPEQQASIVATRRHGMGFLGLGSSLAMLGIEYGSPRSIEFTEKAARELALTGWEAALELSREKGPAPILEQDIVITSTLMQKRPELRRDGYAIGDRVPGRILHAKYSRYMQRIAEVDPSLVEALAEAGARFTHHSSIAPTGTISLSFGNNASNGIEPSFAHHYSRNVIREGKKTKEKIDVDSYELLAYRLLVDPGVGKNGQLTAEMLPDYFKTAAEISPLQHLDIQAAAQKWIDSSISKTINIPTQYPFEEFKHLYEYAYREGLKGCTTFRFNPEVLQGVLVKDEELEACTYRFELDDGTTVEAKGNEEIDYEGEIHNAANLYDALKENYYGRF